MRWKGKTFKTPQYSILILVMIMITVLLRLLLADNCSSACQIHNDHTCQIPKHNNLHGHDCVSDNQILALLHAMEPDDLLRYRRTEDCFIISIFQRKDQGIPSRTPLRYIRFRSKNFFWCDKSWRSCHFVKTRKLLHFRFPLSLLSAWPSVDSFLTVLKHLLEIIQRTDIRAFHQRVG